jgi:DnaJ-like protein
MRTHYDNLKVPETATRDAIKSSYRKLCLQHHPDRNPGDPDAQRIMQIINDAYDVLSDPAKRRAYDQELTLRRARKSSSHTENPSRSNPSREAWQRHEESRREQAQGFPHAPYYRSAPYQSSSGTRRRPVRPHYGRTFAGSSRLVMALIAVVVVLVANLFHKDGVALPFSSHAWLGATGTSRDDAAPTRTWGERVDEARSPASGLFPHAAETRPENRTGYVRAATAPNGAEWPLVPGYIRGYPQAALAGESRLTVDNLGNEADVLVKLFALRDGRQDEVRTCYVPAHAAFTLMGISPGDYDLRYRDLSTGEIRKSAAFPLSEVRGPLGVHYTTMRVEISGEVLEHMGSEAIGEGEF